MLYNIYVLFDTEYDNKMGVGCPINKQITFIVNPIYANEFDLLDAEGNVAEWKKKGMYFFVHNLAINGDADVTVSTLSDAPRTFSGIEGKITNLRWMDNDRPLEHTQMSGTLMMHASGYPYGTNMVVRVAVADVEE